jgi:hypothetical protein
MIFNRMMIEYDQRWLLWKVMRWKLALGTIPLLHSCAEPGRAS